MHKPDMIEVVNLSTRISADEAGLMARVASFQIAKHAALPWGLLPIPVKLVTEPSGAKLIAIFDDADQAEKLGYHESSKLDGQVGRVFASPVLDAGGAVLWSKDRSALTVSAVLSHEALSMFVDPGVNYWADGPDIPEGSEYATEVCHPVQADYYDMPTAGKGPVRVSNFVLPAWFNGAEGPFDYLRHLPRGYSILPGGYMIVRSQAGGEQSIFGLKVDLAQFLATKRSPLARTMQRDGIARSKPTYNKEGDVRIKHAAEVEPVAGPPTPEDVRKKAEAAGTLFAHERDYKVETIVGSDPPNLPPTRQPDPATVAGKQKMKHVHAATPEKAVDAAKARKAKSDEADKPKKKRR